jgi:hypothetical protein
MQWRKGKMTISQYRTSTLGLLIAAALIFTPAFNVVAQSTADQMCLMCHSMSGLSKSLDNGEKLSLHVGKEAFSTSVHSPFGCQGCHPDVDPAKHPGSNDIASAREYTIGRAQVCRGCHAAKFV